MRLQTVVERLKPFERVPLWFRYVLAIALVLVFFAIRHSLGATLNGYPFLLFFLPIIVSAALLGRGSGFVAVAVSTVLAWYFFLDNTHSFAFPSFADALVLALFVLIASASACAIETLRLIGLRLEATKRTLDAQLSLLNSAIDSVPEPMFVKDTRGMYAHANSALATIFGVAPGNVIGHSDREFMTAEQAAAIESVDREVLRTGVVRVVEEHFTPSGESSPRTYLSTKAPWRNPDGSVIGLIGIARDIDARKSFEEQLRSAAELNRILLFDINHRMKNQLQAVSRLLRLAEREVTEDAGRAALAAAARRLSVLARVNDRLHLREGSALVGAADFIEPLCQDLTSSLIEGRPIALRTQIDCEIELDPQRAVSLGLIINELVANALKYAFVDDRPGAVEISLVKKGAQYCLAVTDNGTGMERDRVKAGSGTRLVELLAQQLSAEIAWTKDRGTQVRILFAIADSSRAAASV
jgi:PAS domain S-box-containing protein